MGSIEVWEHTTRHTRQFLKGRGANLGKEKRSYPANLVARVEELDQLADSSGLDEEGWAFRYHLEDQILLFNRIEEDY
jgi:hypothetical protein